MGYPIRKEEVEEKYSGGNQDTKVRPCVGTFRAEVFRGSQENASSSFACFAYRGSSWEEDKPAGRNTLVLRVVFIYSEVLGLKSIKK